MRIGIDATALPAKPVGAGTYIIQLIRALAVSGTNHELIIFAHRSGRDLINSNEEHFIAERTGIQWVVVADKSPARRLIWEQTILPILVQRSGVDVLHSLHYTRPLILPCASVVTFHDMTFFLYPHLHTRAKRIFFPLAMRLSAFQANALIAVSENTRRDAIRILKISPDKIFAATNGIAKDFRPISDPQLLEVCRNKYHLPQEFILYVGTVEPRKNLPVLLKAYSRLARTENPASLVVVGRFGWMYEEVFRQIEASGIKDRVYFTGYIPAEDLTIIYNLARVFVYPSIYEGFGFPPLEAMACGTPVITSANSALSDHIGDAGLLVPPYDEVALAQAMLTVLTDPTLHSELSIKGRSQAAKFTWDHTAQETLKVYDHVIVQNSLGVAR